MPTPLDNYPGVRKALYLIQWLVSLVMGVLGIILAANSGGIGDLPAWYNTTALVLTFVWTYTGITAQTNTSPTPAPDQVGSANPLILIIMAAWLVLVFLTLAGVPLVVSLLICLAAAVVLIAAPAFKARLHPRL